MENNKLDTITNLFEGKEIRSIWNSKEEDYYFSVVDVIRALTDSNIPRNYWSDLKRKLKKEGSQLHENIVQLKMKSRKDGKNYLTDTLDTKGIGLEQNKKIAKKGGNIAKIIRDNLEKELGEFVITSKNALGYKYVDNNKLTEGKKSKDKP